MRANSTAVGTAPRTTALPVNSYGNVDITNGVPEGLAHVTEQRCQPLCRKLAIPFAPAFTGLSFDGFRYKPTLDGIAIDRRHEPALRQAIAQRAARQPSAEVRAARLKRRHDRETDAFAAASRQQFPAMPESEVLDCAAHATEVGSGRVGRSTRATIQFGLP